MGFFTTRYCSECGYFGLEITEDLNTYECEVCGSVWKRLKPRNNGKKMVGMPKKLKKLFVGSRRLK